MTLSRLPQLDGLRAVAVTFVMAFHFIPWVDRVAPLGPEGWPLGSSQQFSVGWA